MSPVYGGASIPREFNFGSNKGSTKDLQGLAQTCTLGAVYTRNWNLVRNRSRIGGLVDVSQGSHLRVIRLAEDSHERLSHPGDCGYGWPRQPSFAEFLLVRVFQEAEEPKLLPLRPLSPDLEVAGHFPVHCLPPAATREAGRRCFTNGLECGQDLCLYVDGTVLKEIGRGNRSVTGLEVDDVPGELLG
jgi:hypothetical protein